MDLSTLPRTPAANGRGAGVCSGLARAWRLDPFLVRVGFTVLALGGGVGLVLYVALWLTMPVEGSDRPILDSAFPLWRRIPRAVLIALLVVAALVVSVLVAPLLPFGLAPSLVLLVMWYVGMHRPRRRAAEQARRRAALARPENAPFTEATDFTRLAVAWQHRVQHHVGSAAQPPAAPTTELRTGPRVPPAYAEQPGYSMEAFLAHPDPVGLYAPSHGGSTAVIKAPRRRRSGRLGWVGVAAIGLALATVALADVWTDPPLAAYFAAALLAVGGVLIAGLRRGRPRGFIALGIALTVLTFAAWGSPGPGTPRRPDMAIVAATEQDIPAEITRETGTVDVDLSQVALTQDRTLRVRIDAGHVRIRVPQDARVHVESMVDTGRSVVLGHEEGGLDVAQSMTDGPAQGPLLTLLVKVDLGDAEVVR